MRDVREAVITEIDGSPTADPSVNRLARFENQAKTPAISPLIIVDLLWRERAFVFRSVLAAVLFLPLSPSSCRIITRQLPDLCHPATVLTQSWPSHCRRWPTEGNEAVEEALSDWPVSSWG